MITPLGSHDHRDGFALVVTLIMVTLAAILAVALLSSASLDRTTAKSYGDRFDAEVAAQNGLEAAKKVLIASPTAGTNSITADDTFLVVRAEGTQAANSNGNKDAYYYMAKAKPGNANAVDCYPLFAGGQQTPLTINLTTNTVSKPAPPTAAFPNPAQETFGATKKVYPQLLPFHQPAYTQWQEIRDPNDTATAPAHNLPYQHYTFWVEDLSGYVDASVAGNKNGASGANRRPDSVFTPTTWASYAARYKTTAGELAMFTLFDPAPPTDSGSTGAKDILANRSLLFTVGTLKQIAPGAGNTDVTSPVLATRLAADSELPLVPFGYGYADEGNATKPRLDLNAQVTGGATAVNAIATKINQNLPTFGTARKGGLSGTDYVKNISASIIDYVDADSDATIDLTPNTGYRGIDSYPFVNEIYTMKWWKSTTQSGGSYYVDIQMDTWVELWNPSNQVISGTAAIDMLENHPVQAGFYTYKFGTKAADLPNGSSVTSNPTGIATISVANMQPNEYTTYKLRSDLFHFNTGVAPPLIFPAAGTTTMPLTATLLSNYMMTWKAQGGSANLVDTAGSNPTQHVQRIGGSLKGPASYGTANKNWRGSYPGFGYTANASSAIPAQDTMGDPRSAFSMVGGQVAINYDVGSSFWVRNTRSNVASTLIYSEQRPSKWPDSGHDSTKVTTSPGLNVTTDPPTTRPGAAVIEPTKAPATISNSGSYATTAELANIYDPGHWNIPPTGNSWQRGDITTAGQASGSYGGGMTLHIGRPEFTLFDKPGTRAWQLLDLLHTGTRINTRGLVNINTASYDALRALGANVLLDRDSNKLPTGVLYPPFLQKQADQFADAVIAARPFLSPAQLSSVKLATANTSLFGNPAAWTNQPAPTEWNDSGTEEYFAKVFSLATVRSRNFRIFTTGQSLDKNGKVLSTVSKVFQVNLSPTRDPTGKITSQNVILTYEAQLPL